MSLHAIGGIFLADEADCSLVGTLSSNEEETVNNWASNVLPKAKVAHFKNKPDDLRESEFLFALNLTA